MAKRSMESALSSSLQAEQQAVETRFSGLSDRAAKADEILQGKATEVQPVVEEPPVPVVPRVDDPPKAQSVQMRFNGEDRPEDPIEKVVRANFSMPADDYELVAQLRDRCSRNGLILSRSEVLRAGLHALNNLELPQLLQVARSLERLKPGPAKRNKNRE